MTDTNLMKTEARDVENYRRMLTLTPPVDIFENEDEVLLLTDVPGVTRDKLTVNVDKNVLTVTGHRVLENLGATDDVEEAGSIEYSRSFTLPSTIDQSKIDARLKDGVLELHLPKAPESKPRQIQVSVG